MSIFIYKSFAFTHPPLKSFEEFWGVNSFPRVNCPSSLANLRLFPYESLQGFGEVQRDPQPFDRPEACVGKVWFAFLEIAKSLNFPKTAPLRELRGYSPTILAVERVLNFEWHHHSYQAGLHLKSECSTTKPRIQMLFFPSRSHQVTTTFITCRFSSKLSPWVAAGCVSPKRVAMELRRWEVQRRGGPGPTPSSAHYLSEFGWRYLAFQRGVFVGVEPRAWK